MTTTETRRPSSPRRSSKPATARAKSTATKAPAQKNPPKKNPAKKVTASRAGEKAKQSARDEQGALSYYLIGGSSILLVIIGVTMVFSASFIDSIYSTNGNPFSDFGQVAFAGVGLVLAFIASRVPVAWYRKLAWPALGLGLFLQSLILTPLGVGAGGNLNWVVLPGVGQIQPAEFLKLAVAVWLGLVLSRKIGHLHDWRHVLLPGVLGAGAAVVLVMAGHDLGTVLVFVAMIAGAYFVAGLPLRWFAAAGVVLAGAAAYLVVESQSRAARVQQFLGMVEDPDMVDQLGYQVTHGLRALGTGGISGVGLGASREKWAYLPAAKDDYILAIIGEELGLLGTLVVIGLFGALTVGLFRVMRRHPDPFVQITTGAVAAWIVGQTLINIGVVVNLLPVIGVPLPLVSAGGSSMVATLLALGMVLSFARDEPGARPASTARPSVVARSLAVISRGHRG